MNKIELQIPLPLSVRKLVLASLPEAPLIRPFSRINIRPLAATTEREFVIGEETGSDRRSQNTLEFNPRISTLSPRTA